ncbi:MAG: hypothetical protein KAT46_03870 [Deltaproteobacteria bacterium]|nr:hypothetical protein [Deltaproteobacteria bacterium]
MTSPPTSFINKLWKKYPVQLKRDTQDWLLTGKRRAFVEIAKSQKEEDGPWNTATKMTTAGIPVLGRVPAGVPTVQDEDIIDYIQIPGMHMETFAVIISGESMMPTLRDGDFGLFMFTSDIKSGDIVVANNEFNETMVKRYRLKNGEQFLMSDNAEYQPITPNEHFRIVGKITGVWRNIKI